MECLVIVLLRKIRTIALQDLFFSNYCIYHYDTMRSSFLTKGFCVNLYMLGLVITTPK